jgi:hypothetical protein
VPRTTYGDDGSSGHIILLGMGYIGFGVLGSLYELSVSGQTSVCMCFLLLLLFQFGLLFFPHMALLLR